MRKVTFGTPMFDTDDRVLLQMCSTTGDPQEPRWYSLEDIYARKKRGETAQQTVDRITVEDEMRDE